MQKVGVRSPYGGQEPDGDDCGEGKTDDDDFDDDDDDLDDDDESS